MLTIIRKQPPKDVNIRITINAKFIQRNQIEELAEKFGVDTLYFWDSEMYRVVSIPEKELE